MKRFHPGCYLREYLECTHTSVEKFAMQLDIDAAECQALIDEKKSVDLELSHRISNVLGTSMAYWWNLQKAYDNQK